VDHFRKAIEKLDTHLKDLSVFMALLSKELMLKKALLTGSNLRNGNVECKWIE
jgi:hypothetical protein